MSEVKDWKLKLRYGKLKTPFSHFTVLADGIVGELSDGFECRRGKAFFGIKCWAVDADEASDLTVFVASKIGFEVTGEVQIFDSEPINPPREKPYGYDINFTPYE